jgi:hypothetical protein
VEHAVTHILNTPVLERQFSKSYLGPMESREAVALRKAIAKGARESLEDQYWDVIERTIQNRPMEARLGGDPSIGNKVRAYLLLRYYQNGEWADRIEVCMLLPKRLRKHDLEITYSLSLVSRFGRDFTSWSAPDMCKRLLKKQTNSHKRLNIARLAS